MPWHTVDDSTDLARRAHVLKRFRRNSPFAAHEAGKGFSFGQPLSAEQPVALHGFPEQCTQNRARQAAFLVEPLNILRPLFQPVDGAANVDHVASLIRRSNSCINSSLFFGKNLPPIMPPCFHLCQRCRFISRSPVVKSLTRHCQRHSASFSISSSNGVSGIAGT